MKEFKVYTFKSKRENGTPLYLAYLRDANPEWEGCKVINVMATTGNEAKKIAIDLRKKMEANS